MPDKSVYVIEGFPGLDLTLDAADGGVRGARDAKNAMIEGDGMLRCRNGFTDITTADFANEPSGGIGVLQGLTSGGDTLHNLVIFENGTLRGGRRSGTSLGFSVAASTAPSDYAQMGHVALGQARLYIANFVEELRYFVDLGGFSAVIAGSPKAFCLETWEAQSRLVAGSVNGGGGAGGNTSTVKFSAVGDGGSWGASDYVDLNPRDGDEIVGVKNWRDRVIVFKSRRFYVFYAVSENTDGSPIFDYHSVDTGVGLHAPRGMAAAPEGVYFVGPDGIYLTNGGPPVKISEALDPVFDGGLSGTSPQDPRIVGYTGPQLVGDDRTAVRLCYLDGVLYVTCPEVSNGSTTGIFAYEAARRRWTWHALGGAVPEIDKLESLNRQELIFYRTGRRRVQSWVPANRSNATDADAAAVSFSYQLTGVRVDSGAGESIIRRSNVTGSGSVNLYIGVNGDFGTSPAVLSMAGSEDWEQAWDARSFKGRSFNPGLVGAQGTFIRRLEHHVHRSRRPNMVSVT